jgi:chromosome segregation ATPase
MSISPTIDQLRRDIDSARTDIARIEGQQESAQEELTRLKTEVEGMGLDPANLDTEATRIQEDVDVAVKAVQAETQALTKETTDE